MACVRKSQDAEDSSNKLEQKTKDIISRENTTCINNGNISILFDENGIRIINTSKSVQLNMDSIPQKEKDWSNEEEWQIIRILEIYNTVIENKDLICLLQYILSSSILTQNILQHPKEIELNNHVLDQLKRFMTLVNFISTYHKDKNGFLGQWKIIFDIITEMTTDIYHASLSSFCIDLHPRIEETDACIQENQHFGTIVFIDSDAKFSTKKSDEFIGIGVTNKSCSFSSTQSKIPINVFGSSLVRVVYPTNNYVDERGMFVILNKNQEENTGIGEIISFGDLINREANSFHLIGICSLDKTEQPNSLFLYSTSSNTPQIRIRHPSSDTIICSVLMIFLPLRDSLVNLFLHSAPFELLLSRSVL